MEEVATVSEEVEVTEPQETADTETPEEETETSVQEDEDSGEESEETESQEDDAEEVEDEGPEEPAKKDAQSRIQQLANEKRELAEKLEALEARVNQTLEQRTEIPAVDEGALNAHLGQMREQIDDLRMDGKHLEADLLERQRNNLIDEYDKWQRSAAEKQQQTTQQQQQNQQRQQAYDAVDVAAGLYKQENNIPDELFKEGGEWFRTELDKSPLLRQQFEEKMFLQGSVAAVDWAYKEKVKPLFDQRAKEAAEAKQKREAGKNKQPGGSAGKSESGPKSYQALLNLGSKQVAAFKKNNLKQYQKLLDAHMK